MVWITFVESSGHKRTVEAVPGQTLMEVATGHGVEGIGALCGGACACATCEVVIAPEWEMRVGKPDELELSMIETEDPSSGLRRLSCQIEIDDALEGLTVHVAGESP